VAKHSAHRGLTRAGLRSYIVENSVVYLCLAQRSYPKKLAFQYLEELARSFSIDHGSEVPKYSRPYAAVNFDPKMAKIRREYLDPQSTKNVNKLAADLTDIHNILVRNIQDVMQRGEKLESMEQMSSSLVSDSKKFEKTSKYVNLQYLYRTYGPLVIVLLVVLLVLYFRFLR
jgi:vesicle transport protein SEC22